MTNPPRSDTVSDLDDGVKANVNIAIFEEDARNTLISELESLASCLPKFVLDLWKMFAHYFKMKNSWYRGALALPGQYLIPFVPKSALTTIQAAKETIYTNSGLARLHMDKFGIQHVKFSREMLHFEEHDLSKGVWDAYTLGYFAEAMIPFTGDGAPLGEGVLYPAYPLHADGSENHKLYFFDGGKPDDIPLYSVLWAMYDQNGTYNPYGGCFTRLTSSTAEDCLIKASRTESDNFEALGFTTADSSLEYILLLFMSL
jgi:hypothetical protein